MSGEDFKVEEVPTTPEEKARGTLKARIMILRCSHCYKLATRCTCVTFTFTLPADKETDKL